MKNFIQHGNVTTYDHVRHVAECSYRMNHRFHLHANDFELIRGAILHDYFLYDWHTFGDGLHGYHHPARALKNAERDFGLSMREKNIISSHMWPLTLRSCPKCREAWIVCLADKICSTYETIRMRKGMA